MISSPARSVRWPALPASPDELEAGYKQRKRRRQGPATLGRSLQLGVGGACCLAAGVILGLLLVTAVSRAYHSFLGPKVEQLAEQQRAQAREAAEQQRRGMLLDRHSAVVGSGWEAADTVDSGAAAEAGLASSVIDTGSSAGSTAHAAALPADCPAHCQAANCTQVRLQDADLQLLRREVDSIVRSLADPRPWVHGLPDTHGAAHGSGSIVAKGQQLVVRGATAVPRISDEAYGPQSSANVPGTEDVHAELKAYNDAMVAAMVLDEAAAAARQLPPKAADLGLQPLDVLSDTASLPQRIAFLNELHEEVQARESLRVCITATTSADAMGVRRELLPWMQYHTELGAAHFYLLYDGSDPEAVRLLGTLRHVTLMHIHPPFASAAEQAKFELYAQGASEASSRQWAGQPGNFQLMVKQGYGEGEALRRAAQDGMHWLLHLDPDELFHPGGPVFSLTAALAREPAHVPAVRFMNFEGQPEAADLRNRIEQVSLFRVHKHFITPEAQHYRPKYVLGGSAAFLTLYANGKSAVRVDAPGVRQMGPHFFAGNPSPRWQTAANPRGEWQDTVSDDSVVLHYAYSYPEEVAAKAHRSCPDTFLEAARRGDKAKVKECFVIEFDQDAYMAAAQGPAAAREFFHSRMVLGEGARVRCTDPELEQQGWCTLTNVERFKYLLEKVGLYRRLSAPQALLRQHERQIQRRLHAGQAAEQQS